MAIVFTPSGHGEPQYSRPRPARFARRAVAAVPVSLPVPRQSRRKRTLALFALGGLTLLAGGLGCGLSLTRAIESRLPSVDNIADLRLSQVTTIVSSDGVTLATLEMQHRRPVSLSEISPSLIDATIATEDSRFYEHGGVDGRGVLRALWGNLRDGGAANQGGSTITQQLARTVYLSKKKTFARKIEEALLARKIEAAYSKREILEAYLNSVYYGNGSYGVEAAAETYFGKSAKSLTLNEAALLAGLPQRPVAFSPFQHREAALRRHNDVLARLAATGKITPAQEAEAENAPLHFVRPRLQTGTGWRAPYFVANVLAQIRDHYGPEFIYSGLRVETTLNWRAQQAAERALRNGLKRHDGPTTGAMVSIDPRTGFVRALVGGANFQRDQFDAITMGLRQPGSTFKPIVYAAAFNAKVCDLTTPFADEKITYSGSKRDWVVHNFDRQYHGSMSVLDAIRHSVNTVAVQVAEQTGIEKVTDAAQRLGITTPLQPDLSLALGASGVHALDLCSAFTAFANRGKRYDPIFTTRSVDARGQDVFVDDPARRLHPSFLSQRALDETNAALREVVTSGTAQEAQAIADAHGKTGTTSSHRDAWFVGYTGDLTTAVWMARAHREQTHDANGATVTRTLYQPMPGATGGQLCVPVWRDFMADAVPVQQAVNKAHGIESGAVPGPTASDLIATIHDEARKLARARTSQNAAQNNANGYAAGASGAASAAPAFEPALNGSGPITVTAPPDDRADTQRPATDAPAAEAGEPTATTPNRANTDAPGDNPPAPP